MNGFGNELNGNMSCKFAKDIKETFEKGNIKGRFYFSHSEALLPFQSLLGLYKDDFKLTHDMYATEEITHRKYLTSLIGSFAQNIGFVFFQCEDAKNKILALHQEKIVHLDRCGETECDWEQFKENFRVCSLSPNLQMIIEMLKSCFNIADFYIRIYHFWFICRKK